MLAVDWSNIGYAGAFIGGMIVGGIAVARITRLAIDWLRKDQRKD